MNSMRWVALVALGWLAVGAQAQSSCAPTGDVNYVCGPKNPEDLVLVPGTQWIVSSGMAEGAGFYLVDSRGRRLQLALPFTAQPDPAFAAALTPPAVAVVE